MIGHGKSNPNGHRIGGGNAKIGGALFQNLTCYNTRQIQMNELPKLGIKMKFVYARLLVNTMSCFF